MRPLRFFGVAADGPVDARQLVATARTAESAGFAVADVSLEGLASSAAFSSSLSGAKGDDTVLSSTTR